MSRRIALPLLIISLGVLSAWTADKQNADWMIYEQANSLMAQKEFGQALKLYQEAIKKAGIFPEAELAIGDIYFEEGEKDLAITQYEKAYNLRKSFYIPDMQYTALYRMADVYEKTELFKKMEDALALIIQDDTHFVETATYRLRTQIEKVYKEKGLDRVLFLYSFDESFAPRAHSKLGWFNYRTGRYSPAVSHLLYSIIYRVSQVKSFIKEKEPDFQFSTMADLIRRIDNNTELRKYAVETGLMADFYYFAGSMYAVGFPRDARAIWRMISVSDTADLYRDLSARQLKKPSLEPLINLKHSE